MAATGYQIRNLGGSGGGEEHIYDVVPSDGTIDVTRTEEGNTTTFGIKTTYDGYETINVGSPNYGGYYKAIHIKFNEENRRYRLVCILNGGSYTPVAKDFAIYYIKFGWRTGGENEDHWYIEEYARTGNGSYVSLEQISLSEYNVLIHTPTGYAYANIGILKEDKEENVTIEHFNPQQTRYTPTGTIIQTEVPDWKNGAPAVWQIIPDIATPTVGQIGHYYAGDRNLYFYDGYNWHNVYSLAQGVAQCLATTDAPATANNGTIYYDTTEQALKIWINGGWQNVLFPTLRSIYTPNTAEYSQPVIGMLGCANNDFYNWTRVWNGTTWQNILASAFSIFRRATWSTVSDGSIGWELDGRMRFGYGGVKHTLAYWEEIHLSQVVTFTDYSGQTIVADDVDKIVVTASFGSTSILDFSNIEKVEGKVIEISNLNGNTFTAKDGATSLHLTNSNESVIKAICLSSVWHYYKVGSITEFT